jgi:hypothetical protein
MKKFLASLPNKLKAGYLVWVTIHFVLYVISGNFLTFDIRFMVRYEDTLKEIYPIEGELGSYDYSEFLLYLLLPVLIYFVYYYWNKKEGKN